jgi:Protein of unknown function (DUF3237)
MPTAVKTMMEETLRKLVLTTAIHMFGLSGAALAQAHDQKLETEYLMTIDLTFGALNNVGPRVSVDVPSGQVKWPRISGTFVPPSGDWPIPMPDGSLRLDVRETLKTDDGEFILIEYQGIIGKASELERLNKGETLTSKDVYWVTAPKFSTASKKYEWINGVQGVAKMVQAQAGKVRYDVYIAK